MAGFSYFPCLLSFVCWTASLNETHAHLPLPFHEAMAASWKSIRWAAPDSITADATWVLSNQSLYYMQIYEREDDYWIRNGVWPPQAGHPWAELTFDHYLEAKTGPMTWADVTVNIVPADDKFGKYLQTDVKRRKEKPEWAPPEERFLSLRVILELMAEVGYQFQWRSLKIKPICEGGVSQWCHKRLDIQFAVEKQEWWLWRLLGLVEGSANKMKSLRKPARFWSGGLAVSIAVAVSVVFTWSGVRMWRFYARQRSKDNYSASTLLE